MDRLFSLGEITPKRLKRGLTAYVSDQRGQAATEYILVIGVVVIPLIVAYVKLQDAFKTALNEIAKLMSGPGI
jgi:Flp pilus assembly pilin Flp